MTDKKRIFSLTPSSFKGNPTVKFEAEGGNSFNGGSFFLGLTKLAIILDNAKAIKEILANGAELKAKAVAEKEAEIAEKMVLVQTNADKLLALGVAPDAKTAINMAKAGLGLK